jgi:hypothetical protein
MNGVNLFLSFGKLLKELEHNILAEENISRYINALKEALAKDMETASEKILMESISTNIIRTLDAIASTNDHVIRGVLLEHIK